MSLGRPRSGLGALGMADSSERLPFGRRLGSRRDGLGLRGPAPDLAGLDHIAHSSQLQLGPSWRVITGLGLAAYIPVYSSGL